MSATIAAMDGETPSAPVHPFYANDATTTAYMTSTAAGTPDYMMSIVASHKFEKHSFEVRPAPFRRAFQLTWT